GEEEDAEGRRGEGGEVASGTDTHRGERDGPQKLDRADGPQREPGDGQVEAAVHRAEHGPQAEQGPHLAPGEAADQAPGTPPGGEHHRRGRDPQPGDAQHVHVAEEEDRERGAEVVEDGADQEEGVRRYSNRGGRGGGSYTGEGHSSRMQGSAAIIHGCAGITSATCLENKGEWRKVASEPQMARSTG